MGETFNSDIIKESVEYIKDSASAFGLHLLKLIQNEINDLTKTVDINF